MILILIDHDVETLLIDCSYPFQILRKLLASRDVRNLKIVALETHAFKAHNKLCNISVVYEMSVLIRCDNLDYNALMQL